MVGVLLMFFFFNNVKSNPGFSEKDWVFPGELTFTKILLKKFKLVWKITNETKTGMYSELQNKV